MPKDLFIKEFALAVNNLSPSQDIFSEYSKLTIVNQDKVIEELKQKFQASKEALGYRIKNLIKVIETVQ